MLVFFKKINKKTIITRAGGRQPEGRVVGVYSGRAAATTVAMAVAMAAASTDY